MPIQLIVNADDFGYSHSVNAAVIKAHQEGILTSASLMVTGDAVREAVAMAKDNPSLAVGLHLALSHARSALPPEVIPNLVDLHSMFPASPIIASLKYFISGKARRQLTWEIQTQFETFAQYGIPLSHVDGHQHLHATSNVLPIVVELAEHYGVQGIRVPRDPLLTNLRVDASSLIQKLAVSMGHAYQVRLCNHFLKTSSLARTDLCIGSLMTGRMSDTYLIGMLERIQTGKIEVYFHPCIEDSGEPLGPNPGDLQTLLSPTLKEYVSKNCSLLTYAQLRNSEAA
ncbi:MAG: hopanoid biosynthesis-associated protein HpnK [Armatimonadetes bacterium]|nr:hopanoid biosynthesis-associated protein HpnK [Armatimonadota bacterium]